MTDVTGDAAQMQRRLENAHALIRGEKLIGLSLKDQVRAGADSTLLRDYGTLDPEEIKAKRAERRKGFGGARQRDKAEIRDALAPELAEAKERRAEVKAARVEEMQAKLGALRAERTTTGSIRSYPSAKFEGMSLSGGVLRHGHHRFSVTGAHAQVDIGAPSSRITLTRVVAIGVFALGAKKNLGKLYVTVELADGQQVVVEAPVKKESEARSFVAAINSSSS